MQINKGSKIKKFKLNQFDQRYIQNFQLLNKKQTIFFIILVYYIRLFVSLPFDLIAYIINVKTLNSRLVITCTMPLDNNILINICALLPQLTSSVKNRAATNTSYPNMFSRLQYEKGDMNNGTVCGTDSESVKGIGRFISLKMAAATERATFKSNGTRPLSRCYRRYN